MNDGKVRFSRLRPGETFFLQGKFYHKIEPVQVGYTKRLQPKYHNCMNIEGKTDFLYAFFPVTPVHYKEIRNGNGKLLFKYAPEYNLVEIKPKGEERPFLVKLKFNNDSS